MKKNLLGLARILPLLLVAICLHAGSAHAYTNSDLIDDPVFDNVNSMSANQIQSFLNQFPNSCLKSYQAPDPQSWYNYGSNVSAAQAIYDSAHIWGINPQVILTTLEKEEGLVDGAGAYGCSATAYQSAMGYDCPGSATYSYPDIGVSNTCVADESNVGFSAQINHGAWQLEFGRYRSESNGNLSWDGDNAITYYGYMTQGSRARYQGGPVNFYSGSITLDDGTTLTVADGATASLYSYTPYIQSFSRIFEQFFGAGSTSATPYQWQVVSQTYSLGSTTITATQKETVTLVAENTGSATWTNTGANPVKLGTSSPNERASSFYDTSWPAPTRPAVMTESSVPPGSNGTFTFTVQAPGPGTYQEHFNLLAEGNTWFSDPGMYFTFNVVPATFSAQYVSSTLPGSLATGTTGTGTVTYKNTGPTTWYNTGNAPVKLGVYGHNSIFADTSWASPDRAATMNESSVAPGSNATFTFALLSPNIPGSYSDSFEPVVEGESWISTPFTANLLATGSYNASVATQSYNVTIPAGTSISQVLSFTNTGSGTWSNSAYPQLKLGTASPFGRFSQFMAPNWSAYNRPSIMNESSVAPGGTGTFNLTLQAPMLPGTYTEAFAPVAEGLTWINTPVVFNITVVPANYSWQIVSQSYSTGTTTLNSGQSETLTVVAKNTGNTTWSNTGSYPVKLATTLPESRPSTFDDGSWPAPNRPAVMTESSVPPGSNGTFTFTIKAPAAGGVYQEHFSLIAEGMAWFNDPGMYFYLNVPRNNSWQIAGQSYSLGSVNISAGQSETLTVSAQNTGDTTWYNNGTYPVKLGTTNPRGRTSAFYNAGWASQIRPAVLTQASVAPGATGTCSFPITAPSTPGTYQEYFSPLAEGNTWFNDPGMYFLLVVH
jgi:hypothetical protein